jgi:dTDP-4-amino-4,6-dideoxygalactose transaminase
MRDKIWLSSPHMGGGEMKYVQEAYSTNWVAPLGPNVDGFERDIQKYTGSPHVAALNSGTAALHLALILADVKPGDYVLCQSMTFSASANPISYLGATPVFIDSELSTWNISPEYLEQAILECMTGTFKSMPSSKDYPAKKPKAIIPVHLYGMPANLDEIGAIASKYDIPVIEDAAESLGSTYKSKATGTYGEMGILSFNGNKIITSSGGGALISKNAEYIEKARFLATQAKDEAPHYEHSQIGYNYRISNILAGIGRGQMEVIQERVVQRRAINAWYREILDGFDGISFQTEPDDDYRSNYWLTAITIDPHLTRITREELRVKFLEDNIESRPIWKPMHLQPVFQDSPFCGVGISESLFERSLCLPSGSNISNKEKIRIEQTLLRALGKY